MVALNFTMFIAKVEDGTKKQTIRSKARMRPGEELQLYVGQRTKKCRKLKDVICRRVSPIILTADTAINNGAILKGSQLEELAHADGFQSYSTMWRFFSERADASGKYHGWLIEWL